MARKQIFYTANSVEEARIAAPGEYIYNDTLEPFEGVYHIANGLALSGASPTPDSRVLKVADGFEGIKFLDSNSSKYFELTRKEYTNHTEPISFFPEPDEELYARGQFQRYFVQKRNEPTKMFEISEEQYQSVNIDNKEGIDGGLYIKFELQWMINGKDAEQINIKNIDYQNRLTPGIKDFLSNSRQFLKFTPPIERYYPDNKVIDSKLPESYGYAASENMQCGNCGFGHNNYCSKWRGQIRKNYWCQSWRPKT